MKQTVKRPVPVYDGKTVKNATELARLMNECNDANTPVVQVIPIKERAWVIIQLGQKMVDTELEIPAGFKYVLGPQGPMLQKMTDTEARDAEALEAVEELQHSTASLAERFTKGE